MPPFLSSTPLHQEAADVVGLEADGGLVGGGFGVVDLAPLGPLRVHRRAVGERHLAEDHVAGKPCLLTAIRWRDDRWEEGE